MNTFYPNEIRLKELTRGFVGREFVFRKIKSFINKEVSGYFFIVGDPGEGKSAIIAKYVLKTRCVAHFNVKAQGINKTEDCIKNICNQLCKKYNITTSEIVIYNSEYFQNILYQVSEKLRKNEEIVIAIDALDEVDLSSQEVNANVLYLPIFLPRGIFILLSKRDVTLQFFSHAAQHVLDLRDHRPNCLSDIKSFLANKVKSKKIRSWLLKQGVKETHFVKRLSQISEYNFMYLTYVIRDIEDGKYSNLDIKDIPLGLKGYYEFHWEKMGMDSKPFAIENLKILFILGVVRQPISAKLLSEFSQEDVIVVQRILDNWRQFIHKEIAGGQIRYSLYHQSFSEFLHQKEIVSSISSRHIDPTMLITDNLWIISNQKELKFKEEINLLGEEKREYILKHLCSHLADNNQTDRLCNLLLNIDYLELKIELYSVYDFFMDFRKALEIVPSDNYYISILNSFTESIGKNLNFLYHHPYLLFQCLWNSCYWKDSLEKYRFFSDQMMFHDFVDDNRGKTSIILETWRKKKEKSNYIWIKLLVPPINLYGSELIALNGHVHTVTCVKYFPDGKLIASGSLDRTVKLWESFSGREVNNFKFDKPIKCLNVSNNGKLLAVGFDSINLFDEECVAIINLATSSVTTSLKGHFGPISCVVFYPDDQHLITGSYDCTCRG